MKCSVDYQGHSHYNIPLAVYNVPAAPCASDTCLNMSCLLHNVYLFTSSLFRSQTVSRSGGGNSEEKSLQMTRVINDIHQMKGRQESIATVLDVLKQ